VRHSPSIAHGRRVAAVGFEPTRRSTSINVGTCLMTVRAADASLPKKAPPGARATRVAKMGLDLHISANGLTKQQLRDQRTALTRRHINGVDRVQCIHDALFVRLTCCFDTLNFLDVHTQNVFAVGTA